MYDVALAVADEHQGRGLGRRLLGALARLALERGVERLSFTALGENRRVLRLFASAGARYVIRSGLAEGELDTRETLARCEAAAPESPGDPRARAGAVPSLR